MPKATIWDISGLKSTKRLSWEQLCRGNVLRKVDLLAARAVYSTPSRLPETFDGHPRAVAHQATNASFPLGDEPEHHHPACADGESAPRSRRSAVHGEAPESTGSSTSRVSAT